MTQANLQITHLFWSGGSGIAWFIPFPRQRLKNGYIIYRCCPLNYQFPGERRPGLTEQKEYAQFEVLVQDCFDRSDGSDDDISDDEMECGKAIVLYLD